MLKSYYVVFSYTGWGKDHQERSGTMSCFIHNAAPISEQLIKSWQDDRREYLIKERGFVAVDVVGVAFFSEING